MNCIIWFWVNYNYNLVILFTRAIELRVKIIKLWLWCTIRYVRHTKTKNLSNMTISIIFSEKITIEIGSLL